MPRNTAARHSQCVAVAAAPHARLGALPLEQDSSWLAELHNITEASDDLPVAAREAVRRVIGSIMLEGCTPWDKAQARALLKRL
jgi:hypothetical protein